LVLEVHWRSATLQFSLSHDGNPVPENVSFFHEVSGQQDRALSFLLLIVRMT
jgi:hypothetical protein